MELRHDETTGDRDATLSLTDKELGYLHGTLFDKVYYGDEEIVYGNGEEAVALRSVLEKVTAEAKKRGV